MATRPNKQGRSRRLAFICTIVASILLKIGCDKAIELWSIGIPSKHLICIALLSWIFGLIALFVALDKAD
jgi:uncharacterized membrane protein YhaH (DUF805 family)